MELLAACWEISPDKGLTFSVFNDPEGWCLACQFPGLSPVREEKIKSVLFSSGPGGPERRHAFWSDVLSHHLMTWL